MLALSAVTLSLLISDIIGILAVAASLTVFGWAVLAIEIYFLVSTVPYMITLCEDYNAYLNGDAEAGDKIIEEVMILSASTLACICVLKILEAFGINVCEWINSKMYQLGTEGTGRAEGSAGGNTLGMENTGGEDTGSGMEGGSGESTGGESGSDVGADGGNTGENGSKTVTSTLGNEIDITPASNHSSVNKNPEPYGEPNTSVDILDANGNVKTRRWYDSDGKACRDVDMSDHGNPKEHPEVPHEHTWEYNNGKPKRN